MPGAGPLSYPGTKVMAAGSRPSRECAAVRMRLPPGLSTTLTSIVLKKPGIRAW